MIDPATSLLRLLREDRRYKVDAYAFVSEAINYAHDVLKMGSDHYSEPVERHRRGRRIVASRNGT